MTAAAREIDLRTELKSLYAAKKKPEILEIPPLNVLVIDGAGAPAAEPFQQAVQALYTSAYTLKFDAKKRLGLNWPVMPLEALWFSADGGQVDWSKTDSWAWRAFIVVPDVVTPGMLDAVRAQCLAKAPAAAKVRVERFEEGKCAQILHVGPYDAESEAIAALDAFIVSQGLAQRGKHHEIYLGDPRRSPPEKWRTIIRHPVG